MKKLPPLVELRAFEAAGRHLSFQKAAAELGVTPTAISHQIRLLERYCGRPLFRRRPRPMTMTDAGARLFPVIRDGLEAFAAAIAAVKSDSESQPLRVTTTNAFASRWLVQRLAGWRARHANVPLEVIGTDAVMDLGAGEVDVAIRNVRDTPKDGIARELFRDEFWPLCNPHLLSSGRPLKRAADLRGQVLIHQHWPAFVPEAPTWERWLTAARNRWRDVPQLNEMGHLSFREELHAIDAVIAGQGIGICSDVLVAQELASGALVRAFDLKLPGYGFYLVYRRGHRRQRVIDYFYNWLQTVR
jgi:LysR family transcriptional regulator, glycine cleavage system transcriptional activator